MQYMCIFRLVLRRLLVARKEILIGVFNRLDLPVEESRPDRFPSLGACVAAPLSFANSYCLGLINTSLQKKTETDLDLAPA